MMLQALLLAPGTVELRQTPLPEPARGELLVRVSAALTCGTDLKAFRRGHPMIPMPGPFGHEFSGVVERAGAGVRKFKPGCAIMAVHSAPCLKCPYCAKGLHNLCENIMATKVLGAFAEFILLPSHVVSQNTFIKPPGLSFEEAALLEPLACVVHGVAPLGLKKGDTALVVGAGPIGLMHVMLLARMGVRTAVLDPHRARLNMAKKLGAEFTGAPDRGAKAAAHMTGQMGFDAAIDCTGRPQVWQDCVGYVRRAGTVVLFGGCPTGTTVTYDTHCLHYDEITIRGDFHFTPADVKIAYGLLASGTLPTASFITARYPLAKLEKALGLLAEGKGVKYAIVPG